MSDAQHFLTWFLVIASFLLGVMAASLEGNAYDFAIGIAIIAGICALVGLIASVFKPERS